MSAVHERLLELFGSGSSAQIVVLQGEVGRGKTFAVQRFYDALCRRDEDSGWLPGLAPDGLPRSREELLLERKLVHGRRSRPVSARTPWLWLAATARPALDGADDAAADLAGQLDRLALGSPAETALAAGRVVGDAALDILADLAGVGLGKTLVEMTRGLVAVAATAYDARETQYVESLRRHQISRVERTLETLGVHRAEDGRGTPLVAVLDDAHLAAPEALRLLSALLVPGTRAAEPARFFPTATAPRQNPVLVVLCRWTHTGRAPALADIPLNRWLGEARAAGVPVTEIDVPNGLPPADARALTARYLPALTQTDRDAVMGPERGGRINPLVLKLRVREVTGWLDDPALATELPPIDVTRLPLSPLDPVRQLFDELPPGEKAAVSTLAAWGSPLPAQLLSDGHGPPDEVLGHAIARGLVSRLARDDDPIGVVGFTDDLSIAFFEEAMPARDGGRPAAVSARLRGWVERLAADPGIPVSAVPLIGGFVTAVLRDGEREDGGSAFAAAHLFDATATATRRFAVVQRFRQDAGSWSSQTVGGEMLAAASLPRALGEQAWATVFATAAARDYVARHGASLAARAVALNRATVASVELSAALGTAADVDGERALWRLGEIAPLIDDFAVRLREITDRHPGMSRTAALVAAQVDGPDRVIELLGGAAAPEDAERLRLADAYATLGRFDRAAATLAPLAEDPEIAVRAARFARSADDPALARALAAPHAVDFLEAATVLADATDDLEEALDALRPHLDSNPHARGKVSQLLSQAGRYAEALAVLEPIADSDRPDVEQAIRSLRTRHEGTPREATLARAEEAWGAGELDAALDVLRPALHDPAVASAWAEYAWVHADRAEVVRELDGLRRQTPTLSISLGELACERPEQAREHGWLADADDDQDLWLSGIRLVHQLDGVEGVRALAPWERADLGTELRASMTALASAGREAEADVRLALGLERQGHPDWAAELLAPWTRTGPAEAHSVRLLVAYGQLDRAADALAVTRNRSVLMTGARACLHLAQDDPGGAGRAFARCVSQTPQVRRLTQLIPAGMEDPQAALEASRLLVQIRQHSVAVAMLAAFLRVSAHPDVRRAYERARRTSPEALRRALGRHRRRHAIRESWRTTLVDRAARAFLPADTG